MRSAIGVSVALLGGFLTGQPIVAVAAAIGAMSTGFGSLQGVYRTRAATMLQMGLAMAFSTAVAMLVSHSVVLCVLAVAVWGFAYGMISSLGPAASAIGVNATIALIVFEHCRKSGDWATRARLRCSQAASFKRYCSSCSGRSNATRKNDARSRTHIASWRTTRESSDEHDTVPSTAALRTVRATLADPRPFGRRAAGIAFQTLLDEAERIRTTLALVRTTEI